MRSIRRFLLLAAALLVLLVPLCALAAENPINSYDVNITVGEDGIYHVVEKIQMSFAPDSESHGLYRQIPLQPSVFFEEEGEYYSREYRVLIRDLDVNEKYETSADNGILNIRVGDPDVLVDGQTIDYELTYDYDPGDDGFADFDMFYYGIIGTEWGQPISDVTFTVTMPKDFDAQKVGFSVGGYGAEGYDPATMHYSIDGNVITGSLTRPLEPYEGVTLRISLPSDYFVRTRKTDPGGNVVGWLSAGATVSMGAAYLTRRQKKRAVITVEFEPPAGLTSADVGYVIDGLTEDRDVLSLLLYWAEKGYMKIVEIAPEEGKKPKKNPPLLFVKLKDLPPTANGYETLMFDALFQSGPRVSTEDLKYEFATTIQDTRRRIKDKWNEPPTRIFTEKSALLMHLCALLSAAPTAALAAYAAYYASYEVVIGGIAGVFVFILLWALAAWWCIIRQRWLSSKLSSRRVSVAIWSILLAASLLIPFLAAFTSFGFLSALPCVATLVLMLLTPGFRTRTRLGNEYLGKILGLRQFIERAELDRLKMLAAQNPEYFYSILPYAYVLGLSEIWAKQFESLAVGPPDWYVTNDMDTFTTIYITNSILNGMDRAQSSMAVQRTEGGSGGGGGFSGGSFSGGGFGGGGGGSW